MLYMLGPQMIRHEGKYTPILRPFRCFRDHPCVLFAGEKGKGGSGKPLHFKGSTFHRVHLFYLDMPWNLVITSRNNLSLSKD